MVREKHVISSAKGEKGENIPAKNIRRIREREREPFPPSFSVRGNVKKGMGIARVKESC